MKILSLFDGMACGMIAMLNAGIEVESYDAYEIDKHAIKVSSHNFPNIRHHGDVFKADFTRHRGVDFLIGGSPCTYWSIAQKNGRETEASGMGWELFCQYVRALKEAEPAFFIYENNKSMSSEIRESITKTFGFEPVCINSALVSAQNRNRLYWVGQRNADGTYSKVNVEQPEDRGILLQDILDHATDAVCVAQRGRYTEYGLRQHYEVREDGKTNVLTTVTKDNKVCEPVRIGTWPRSDGVIMDHQQSRIYSVMGKSTNLNANGGGQGAKTGLYAFCVPRYAEVVKWDEFGNPTEAKSYADGKVYPVYRVKNGQITINDLQYPIKLEDGFYIIRNLTIRESKKLQTVPDWYDFSVISNAQAYKCLGNGWTCDVITHLIKAILTAARRKWLDELLGDCL